MGENLQQGGQRCYRDTVTSLVSAEARYIGVLQEWAKAVAIGPARPDNLRVRKLEAGYAQFDARVRHASNAQGEADLTARCDRFAHAGPSRLESGGRDLALTDFYAFAEADTDYLECIGAIAEGVRMRKRNQDIADVNVNNELTPHQVAGLDRYPDASEQRIRDATIANAERQSHSDLDPDPMMAA